MIHLNQTLCSFNDHMTRDAPRQSFILDSSAVQSTDQLCNPVFLSIKNFCIADVRAFSSAQSELYAMRALVLIYSAVITCCYPTTANSRTLSRGVIR